jgi:hypothetical protein
MQTKIAGPRTPRPTALLVAALASALVFLAAPELAAETSSSEGAGGGVAEDAVPGGARDASDGSAARSFEKGVDTGFAWGLDLIVRRPVTAVAVAVGFGLFVVSAPFAAIGDDWREGWETFVKTPFDALVYEPLGRF